MNITGMIIDNIDSLLMSFGSNLKQNLSDYCTLETAEDEYNIAAQDGSILTILKVNGVKNLTGPATFYGNIINPLNMSLQNFFSSKSHAVQFWFEVDPEKTKKEIKMMLEPAYQTSNRLELDVDDMLEERIENISNWTSYEACYMALWTKPTALSKHERKSYVKYIKENNKNYDGVTTRSQDPLAGISMLRDRHNSFVNTVVQDFKTCTISVSKLNVNKALHAIKSSVDINTGPDWKASLPGDRILPNIRKVVNRENAEEWDIIWPKLSWQICNKDAKVIDDKFVEIGDYIYAPVYIDLFAKEVGTFFDLFYRLVSRNIPWRYSFLLEGDGLDEQNMKGMFASILSFASSDNKLIKNSIDTLKDLQQNGDTIVKVRCSLTTWVSKHNPKAKEEISRRLIDLSNGVEGWGSCLVSEVTGDPVYGVMSGNLGVSSNNIGTASAAPLSEALSMQPLIRPCSPWDSGAVTFRSPDRKLMPYQPGSSKQTTWISLIFAKPGSGKSVLMNQTNLALCLAPGIERLPRIAIIDIGPSSSGLISLLKEALPLEKRHLVAYYRLRMTKEYAVNAFDTQLGCRFPTSSERTFLSNFLTLLVTDANSEKPYDGMVGLVNAVIDEMYKKSSDKYLPNPYTKDLDYKVDEAVNKINMFVDARTTWWEIVDELFKHNYKHEASLAQRYAVPLLSDANTAANEEKIRDVYGKVRVDQTGETLVEAFSRMVSDAARNYPILTSPTKFDIGEARVVSLDLDEVAKPGGVAAERQAAVMYMLARYLLAKDFYLTPETVNEMPAPATIELPKSVPIEEYKEHHEEKAKQIKQDLKRICFDEFHRTSKAQMVRDQVLVDMREGRKWGVDVTLSSQALEDFDSTMLEFATGIFIMDGGNEKTVEKIASTFGISDNTERAALRNNITGPRAGGGTFLAKFSTKEGWYSMLLSNPLGPIELWAFNTTAEDVFIRNELYKLMTPKRARQLLAIKYSNGSAKDDVDLRKEKMREAMGGAFGKNNNTNVYDEIIKEIIELDKNRISIGK